MAVVTVIVAGDGTGAAVVNSCNKSSGSRSSSSMRS